MTWISRYLSAIVLLGVAAVPAAGQPTFTVATCFSEVPGSSCSPIEADYPHSLSLEGPIPGGSARSPELVRQSYYFEVFHDVPAGNYILRTDGCNPFGCWLDTPVTVVDQDVEAGIRQIGPLPTGLPAATPTPTIPCRGDWDGDGRVTIDEIVAAVANALAGCPTNE